MEEILKTSLEVVYDGWLIKSPPTKLWKARWRERWFSLRHSGELPGQYILEYYVDKECKKLKGKIDLDQCEQVDAGLSFVNGKTNYKYMFSIQIPKRIYYLVANSDLEMNKWVNAICQVCGLKAYTQDDSPQHQIISYESQQDSPLVSPRDKVISSPYIPISECITGNRIKNEDYDTCHSEDLPLQLINQVENVYDKRNVNLPPKVNWETFPTIGDLNPYIKVNNVEINTKNPTKQYRQHTNSFKRHVDIIDLPPRPPKPIKTFTENCSWNYLNLDGVTESSKPNTPVTSVYGLSPNYGVSSFLKSVSDLNLNCNKNVKEKLGNYYCEYNPETEDSSEQEDQLSPTNSNFMKNGTSSISTDSTMTPPPLIFRDLKPSHRKILDSSQNTKLNSSCEPVNINRKCHLMMPKLKKPHTEVTIGESISKYHQAATNHSFCDNSKRKRYSSCSDDDNFERDDIFVYEENEVLTPAPNQKVVLLQYLDLDLDASENPTALPCSNLPLPNTVYKTVDFVKTDAFNRTRQRLEEERKKSSVNLI